MEPAQCRAARQLLGWSQEELARRASVSIATVKRYESGMSDAAFSTIKKLTAALQKAGIVLIDDTGVNLPKRRG